MILTFYKKGRDIFKQSYHGDAHFRARQKEYNLFKLFKFNKTSALKVLHKIHSAQEIQYKYKQYVFEAPAERNIQDSHHDIVQIQAC